MLNRKLQERVAQLEARCRELEERVRELVPRADFGAQVDQALRDLGRRSLVGQPQMNYFNERFRTFELAARNVKQLGYELGRRLASVRLSQHGVPSLVSTTELTSSLCKQQDIESAWFAYWCHEMKTAPIYHRKIWELAYICQMLWSSGKLKPGSSGLGFGCGREVLPSVFAKRGVSILATDLEPSREETAGWSASNEYAGSAEGLRYREICPEETLLQAITFRPVDMNALPADLEDRFDFCWSSCALEHLGSLKKGTAFIENSLKTLKRGGVAVHTTEFNLSDGETIDNWITVLYQRRHIEELVARLTDKGYRVAPLDFSAGENVLDGYVDIPPWSDEGIHIGPSTAHLKLSVDGFACTSLGLVIERL
jgi:2-polyprenyl-3-methyl-5-hydroxy-6-metoxy-1,4-benzoquinol methylase